MTTPLVGAWRAILSVPRRDPDLLPSGCGAAASAARGEHRSSVTPSAPLRSVQKLSALMTSPPALVLRAHQVLALTLSFPNRTEPSSSPVFTPPEWYELAPAIV